MRSRLRPWCVVQSHHSLSSIHPASLSHKHSNRLDTPAPVAASRLTHACKQDTCTAFEACSKPVIAAVHGACIGAGVDIITACDIRICSADATFCVKEVDVAITADMGTLQRLPRLVGDGRARELALTARSLPATEALAYGLVTTLVHPDSLPHPKVPPSPL